MSNALPLSLYVHLPWCVRKCPYCDFNSHALNGELQAPAYIDALLADLEFALADLPRRPVQSVFFGGGTPSLFAAKELGRVLERLAQRDWLAADAEITMEANPGTLERHGFGDYAAIGINRVSLGAQSFDPDQLRALGRIHDPDDTRRAANDLHAAGLDNFNIDLMFALPGQHPESFALDLEAALALRPAHLSAYQLTIEPNTAFAKHPPSLPDEDTCWAIQQRGQALLAEAGFRQYEVSAYAPPGRECRHNRNYWEYGDYLGVGAGAHQKLTDASGEIIRVRRRAHPGHYQRGAGSEAAIAERRAVPASERIFEFMLNALRLRSGFSCSLFEQRTRLPWSEVQPSIAAAQERGLLSEQDGCWRASELGWRFMNDVQALFLPPGEAA